MEPMLEKRLTNVNCENLKHAFTGQSDWLKVSEFLGFPDFGTFKDAFQTIISKFIINRISNENCRINISTRRQETGV